jgi:hypothetical protein
LICKKNPEVLAKIYEKVVLKDMISLIDYNSKENAEIYKSFYPNLIDIETYEFLFFGSYFLKVALKNSEITSFVGFFLCCFRKKTSFAFP